MKRTLRQLSNDLNHYMHNMGAEARGRYISDMEELEKLAEYYEPSMLSQAVGTLAGLLVTAGVLWVAWRCIYWVLSGLTYGGLP